MQDQENLYRELYKRINELTGMLMDGDGIFSPSKLQEIKNHIIHELNVCIDTFFNCTPGRNNFDLKIETADGGDNIVTVAIVPCNDCARAFLDKIYETAMEDGYM